MSLKHAVLDPLGTWATLRRYGGRELAQRVARRVYDRVGSSELDFPLLRGDVADSGALRLAAPAVPPDRGTRLVIGWLTTPPSAGSGGHTTMFRMIEALETAGHRCVVFLYDRHGGDAERHAEVIRRGWGRITADVRDVSAGFEGIDAVVATSWQTAHVLATRGATPVRRLYFVQDFEPYFYARGSEYALAEDSYRLGFRTIALGEMVAERLRSQVGIEPDVVPFGCDTDVYRALPGGTRSGVVFYSKPNVSRRGYILGRLALEEFHRRHPEQEIHVYGQAVRDLTIPVTWHGRLTPVELNVLYNHTIAGLAMSFTNISLVAEEMLAGGTIPVVNDSPHSRADLPNEFVRWAPPTPSGLANALSEAVEAPDRGERARLATSSIRKTWSVAQAGVVAIVEDEVWGRVAPG